MLYALVVSVTMLLCWGMAFFNAVFFNRITILGAFLQPMSINAYVLVVLGITCLLMRLLPSSLWNADKKIYRVSDREIKIYDKLKIKSWKDKIPEMGKLANFPKDKIYSTEINYISKFVSESVFAEYMHAAAGILGFTALLFTKTNQYYFAIPILVINMILHVLPCIIQRYNRCRLYKIYDILRRRENSLVGQSEVTITTEEKPQTEKSA